MGHYPYVRFLFPLVLGILCSIQISPGGADFFCLGIFGPVLWLLYLKKIHFRLSFSMRYLQGALLALIIFFLSFSNAYLHEILRTGTDDLSDKLNRECFVSGRICSDIGYSDKSVSAQFECLNVNDSAIIPQKIMLWIKPGSKTDDLNEGDYLIIKTRISEISGPLNPYAFDYRKYMLAKGIRYSMYADTLSWEFLDKKNIYKGSVFERIRKEALCKIDSSGLDINNKAIAKAMLLGFKDDLGEELSDAFSHAGAIHILCVSGLHVGVIWLMASSILKFIFRNRKYRVLVILLNLAVIWCYSLITGMSPSVTRASTMFSIMLLSNLSEGKNNSLNALAASAFFWLWVDPSLIYSPGFQLSHLAVCGIVLLYNPIKKIWSPQKSILAKVYDIILISIIAQLFTFPVSVAYFHQFPNYFLLTNLLVIPLSSLVLYTGMAFLLIPDSLILSDLIIQFLDIQLSWMGYSVNFIEKLPSSVSSELNLTDVELVLIYLIIISLAWFIVRVSKQAVFIFLISVFTLIIFRVELIWTNRSNDEMIVYQISGKSAIDILRNNRCNTLFADSLPDKTLKYNVLPFRINRNIKTDRVETIELGNKQIIEIDSFRIAVITKENQEFMPAKQQQTDIIILSNKAKIDPDDMDDHYITKLIILDGSISYYTKLTFIEWCGKNDVELYITNDTGAFRIELS